MINFPFINLSFIENADGLNLDAIWKDLENSLTINFSYKCKCTDPNVGFALHKDASYFKLYLGDTSLFVTLAFWDNNADNNELYRKLLSDKLSADLGAVYENIVAQYSGEMFICLTVSIFDVVRSAVMAYWRPPFGSRPMKTYLSRFVIYTS